MSSVYIFGNAVKTNIIDENQYITNIIIPSEFTYYDNIGFYATLIKDFLVDEPIEITNILVQFYNEQAHSTKELYWTDKRVILSVQNSSDIFSPTVETTSYYISGSEHNVPFSEINANKIIEANKNFLLSITFVTADTASCIS